MLPHGGRCRLPRPAVCQVFQWGQLGNRLRYPSRKSGACGVRNGARDRIEQRGCVRSLLRGLPGRKLLLHKPPLNYAARRIAEHGLCRFASTESTIEEILGAALQRVVDRRSDVTVLPVHVTHELLPDELQCETWPVLQPMAQPIQEPCAQPDSIVSRNVANSSGQSALVFVDLNHLESVGLQPLRRQRHGAACVDDGCRVVGYAKPDVEGRRQAPRQIA